MRKSIYESKFQNNIQYLIDNIKPEDEIKYVWGLDISLSNTGLTIYDYKKHKYKHLSFKFKGSTYSRMYQLDRKIQKIFNKYIPDLVVIEGYSYGSRNNRETLGETSYAVKRSLLRSSKLGISIPALIVAPQSLKKFVALKAKNVKSNDKKKYIHKIVTEEWGMKTENHDQSDSCVLCVMGINMIGVINFYKNKDFFDYKDMNKLSYFKKERIEVLSNLIVNDGDNIKRFYIDE